MFWVAMGLTVLAIVLRYWEGRRFARENAARVARWNEFQAKLWNKQDA